MSRGAHTVARLLAGAPASAVDLDDLDADWRPLAEVLLDAPDRGAALEAVLAQRPDGQQRWAELLAADALAPDSEHQDRPKRFHLVTPQQMKQLPRPEWQVEGVLHRDTLALLAGPEGTFKSFVALDLALSVAGGRPWQGRAVHQGPVVYISAEGSAGVRNRLEAWETARQTTAAETCSFVPDDAPQFLDGADIEALLETIGELATPPVLIVVDTLARCMVGGDENAAKDMGLFVAGADRLRQATGATVLLIHHHGKAGVVRGSTALVAAVDTILEAKRDGTLLTLSCGKQKDAAPFESIHLVRRIVELGSDDTGQVQSSLVLDPGDAPAADTDLPDLQQRVLGMLVDAFGSGGATDAQWRDLCLDEGVSRRSFYRVKKGLVETKRVVALDRGRRSIYLPGEHAFGANGAKPVPTGAMAPTPTVGADGATVPHSFRSGTAGTTGTTGRDTETPIVPDLTNQTAGGLPLGETGAPGTADADSIDEEQGALLQREQRALVTLDETFGARGATDAEWREACIERGQGRTSYYRAKPVLLARGLVVVEGTGAGARYWLAHERAAAVEPGQSQRQVPGTSGSNGTGTSGTGGTAGASGTSDRPPDGGEEELEGGLPWR